MPRPHLPTHLSLRSFKSTNSVPTTSSTTGTNGHHNGHNQTNSRNVSRNASPTRMNQHGHGDYKGTGLALSVHVLKGRNLAPKDKSGTSDPYLVLALGDSRQATSVMPKTLNPEWNQKFDLPINGADALLLEAHCWDKDRYKKDYMGEFDVTVEDIFKNGHTTQEPKWYKLKSKRSGKKSSIVSGECLLQISIHDPSHASATPQQILQKFYGIVALEPPVEDEDLDDLAHIDATDAAELMDEEDEEDLQPPETDDPKEIEQHEKHKRRKRLAKLKRKTKLRAYEFSGTSDVAGVLFVELQKLTDLPPERNVVRTSFDMDPFVVTSLGKKTYRTRTIRHNLNPVYDEKYIFQVFRHEVNYHVNFTVVDKDKFSGNDFVGTTSLALETVKATSPEANPETGLYKHIEPPSPGGRPPMETRRSRFRIPMSRSSSATNLSRSRNSSSNNLNKMSRTISNTSIERPRPMLKKEDSVEQAMSENPDEVSTPPAMSPAPTSNPVMIGSPTPGNGPENGTSPNNSFTGVTIDTGPAALDPDLKYYALPLELKNKDRWEDKHRPVLHMRAKYLPYQALRQQFWRALLRQYDADDSGRIDRVELTTMLDTLGSTLRNSTIDSFFSRFADENGGHDDQLTMDQAVICLEDQLNKYPARQRSLGDTIRGSLPSTMTSSFTTVGHDESGAVTPSQPSSSNGTPLNNRSQTSIIPALEIDDLSKEGEEGGHLPTNDLADDDNKGEEHVVEIQECPLCHQPRLDKKSEADIITHIATCASHDWQAVNNIVMGGFVTTSQAQRKWYSKVITKIGYGGYKIGANSANILVQDRTTGQINEERMSIYVRLGIRLLYKGLKSREMETKRIRRLLRSLSVKQGRKYDDPASASQIPSFVNFHQLNMAEVLKPISEFKNFNEFFYRKLKPEARPCSAPDRPAIITSPADCRSVVFNRMEDAQRIWVKGREFSVERLLGDAYPEDAKRYSNGALGIFRLAPQDYHRFHIPVDGIMGEPKAIDGEYYTVNPMAIRSALDVYGENIRVVVPIDSVKHGRVMVICVGAMMVGSTIITRKAGEQVKRAEELGYFKFGGSTLLLLFEPGSMVFDQDIVDNSNGALETLVKVGMSIGHSPDQAPHTPDMRKDNPSMAEKQEAKRRIEGSFAPRPSNLPMAGEMK